MTIGELVKQGLHYARTCRSLWLFGFVVGAASGGSSGGGNSGGGGAFSVDMGFFSMSFETMSVLVALAIALAFVVLFLRFISEGALIEGIARVRKGETPTVGDGFRAGWAHWSVLFRIAVLYVVATILSLAALAAPVALAIRAAGWPAGVVLGIPALVIAVPWLITLFLVQAFASRIAVLENRRALDAIRKARLFLHHRLMHGLKLIVATLIGSLVIVLLGFAAMAPVALVLFGLAQVVNVFAVILIGCLIAVPALFVMAAMVGTLKSSIWTIGYLAEMES